MKVEIVRCEDLPVPVVREEQGGFVRFLIRADLITAVGAATLEMVSNAALCDKVLSLAS